MFLSGAVVVGSVAATTPVIADEATQTTTVSGFVTATSEHSDAGDNKAPFLLRVPGQGYLNVDYSAIELADLGQGETSFKLEVPATLELGSTSDEKFDALLESSLEAPLAVVDTSEESLAEARVNVSYATTAVHKIYAVPVTPANNGNVAPDAAQQPAAIASNVATSNSYWNSQSGGRVKFSLEGTTGWYKSATSCDVENDANATALWNEARNAAIAQLGFEDAYNSHLVVIFPSNTDCGGAVGLGTVGYTINQGGILWTIGGITNYEKATLTHELGHNLSLGHASMINCNDSTPNLFSAECTSIAPYGDAVDVMGYGSSSPDLSGGAVSSAQAIRSGLWSSTAWSVTKPGTETYSIYALSGNSGRRALEVVGRSGTSYFVEFRNNTGEDAGYKDTFGCDIEACASNRSGVRVLVLDQTNYGDDENPIYLNGYAGDDSLVIGRSASDGIPTIDYGKGQYFSLDGVRIAVASIGTKTASVTVTTPRPTASYWDVYVDRTVGWEKDELTAGDVLTAFAYVGWSQTSISYQWYRGSTAISGATKQHYTLGASDIGKRVTLKVVGKTTGYYNTPSNVVWYDDSIAGKIVQGGVLDTGTVQIDNSTTPLKAKLVSWLTPSVSYSYQWLRNGAAISGATASTYTPSVTDNGKLISVKVTARKSGFTTRTATSEALNVTLAFENVPSVNASDVPRVGQLVTADLPSPGFDTTGLVWTYQWYRSGTAITGKTASAYTLSSYDLGKTITVRVVARKPGFAPYAAVSAPTAVIAKGDFGSASVSIVPSSTGLVASVTGASVRPTVTYQWYRGDVKITGATAATYKQTTADTNKYIWVRATLTRTAYNTLPVSTMPTVYTIVASGKPVISSSTPVVGSQLSVELPSYTFEPATLDYTWFANGVVITGAKAATFTPTNTQLGKTLTVRVIARAPGLLTSVETSVATQAVVNGLG